LQEYLHSDVENPLRLGWLLRPCYKMLCTQMGLAYLFSPLPQPLLLNVINIEATCEFSFHLFLVKYLPRPIDGCLKGGLETISVIVT
jgi:hypothetical protein